MNEFLAGFRHGFKRGIWRWFALPVAVGAAVVRTVVTLGFEDEDPGEAPTRKPQNSGALR
jgi:hypothetical protein